jgi:LSD1 subclass zinc finger protein
MENYEDQVLTEWENDNENNDRSWSPVPTHSPALISKYNTRTIQHAKQLSKEQFVPNFKCYSCNTKFFLPRDQKIIRCSNCGYRILLKVRTSNHITYKTE